MVVMPERALIVVASIGMRLMNTIYAHFNLTVKKVIVPGYADWFN